MGHWISHSWGRNLYSHVIICVYITTFISSYISLCSLTTSWTRTSVPKWGDINIPMVCCASSLSFWDPNAVQWKSLQTTQSEKFAYSLSKRSYHCMVHSYSWGHGQTGALIGLVKAQNPPLWSELTATGWLFISNHIPGDPVVHGNSFHFWLHMLCNSRLKNVKWFKTGGSWSKLQSTSAVLLVCTFHTKWWGLNFHTAVTH